MLTSDSVFFQLDSNSQKDWLSHLKVLFELNAVLPNLLQFMQGVNGRDDVSEPRIQGKGLAQIRNKSENNVIYVILIFLK